MRTACFTGAVPVLGCRRWDPRSRLGTDDESFYCAGGAHRVDADAARSAVSAAMPHSDIDKRHNPYELWVAKALWTTWTTPTSPVHRTWTCAEARPPDAGSVDTCPHGIVRVGRTARPEALPLLLTIESGAADARGRGVARRCASAFHHRCVSSGS